MILSELKLLRKSPANLPRRSPKLKAMIKQIEVQTVPNCIFLARARFGNSMKVIQKLRNISNGQGKDTLRACHMMLAQDQWFGLSYNYLSAIYSLSLTLSLQLSIANNLMLRQRSKKFMQIAMIKQNKIGVKLLGSTCPMISVMRALKQTSTSPLKAVPTVYLDRDLLPQNQNSQLSDNSNRLADTPMQKQVNRLRQNPSWICCLHQRLMHSSNAKNTLTPVTPHLIITWWPALLWIQWYVTAVKPYAAKMGMGKYRQTLYEGQTVAKQSRDVSTAFQPTRIVMPLTKNMLSTLDQDRVHSSGLSTYYFICYYYCYNLVICYLCYLIKSKKNSTCLNCTVWPYEKFIINWVIQN